ncbi:MAG: sensor histidine kinase [Acidimicrobiales bacterium]
MAAVLAVSRRDLQRPWLAVALVGLALAVTAMDTALLRRDSASLLRRAPVLAELVVGAALVLADGWAYEQGHAFSTSQSLGSVWPLAGILAASVAIGARAAAGAGVLIGVARIGAVVANGAEIDSGGKILSLLNTIVFYALGGSVAGYLMHLLARAERQISAARAREEVARTLHDGVLQTLAVVERRANDPELARMARQQELELREFLFGTAAGTAHAALGGGDLGAGLRHAAARFEQAFGGRVDVIVAEDVPALDRPACDALVGAAGEALMNAGKHGRASKVTVYVEPTEDGESSVFCSIKDDGAGFDPSATTEGVGLTKSVRARIEEVGGRVEVLSSPGDGAEVCMWLP